MFRPTFGHPQGGALQTYIKKVSEPMHKWKTLSFKITWFELCTKI